MCVFVVVCFVVGFVVVSYFDRVEWVEKLRKSWCSWVRMRDLKVWMSWLMVEWKFVDGKCNGWEK